MFGNLNKNKCSFKNSKKKKSSFMNYSQIILQHEFSFFIFLLSSSFVLRKLIWLNDIFLFLVFLFLFLKESKNVKKNENGFFFRKITKKGDVPKESLKFHLGFKEAVGEQVFCWKIFVIKIWFGF